MRCAGRLGSAGSPSKSPTHKRPSKGNPAVPLSGNPVSTRLGPDHGDDRTGQAVRPASRREVPWHLWIRRVDRGWRALRPQARAQDACDGDRLDCRIRAVGRRKPRPRISVAGRTINKAATSRPNVACVVTMQTSFASRPPVTTLPRCRQRLSCRPETAVPRRNGQAQGIGDGPRRASALPPFSHRRGRLARDARGAVPSAEERCRAPAWPASHQNGKPGPDMGFIRRVALLNADGARRVGEMPQPSPADRQQ